MSTYLKIEQEQDGTINIVTENTSGGMELLLDGLVKALATADSQSTKAVRALILAQSLVDTDPSLASVTNRRKTQPYQGANKDIAEELINWRREKARELAVPPYFILHQRVLYAIADKMPLNNEELLAISGIGPSFVEKYGNDVLAITNA